MSSTDRDDNSSLRELAWFSRFYEKHGRKDLVRDILQNVNGMTGRKQPTGENSSSSSDTSEKSQESK